MKKLNLFIGVAALLLAFALNARHALNDYGVSDPSNKLHPEVLAQTNTAGAGGGSSVVCNCGVSSGAGTNNGHASWCRYWDSRPGGGGSGWSDKEDPSCQSNYGGIPRTETCNAGDWWGHVVSSVRRACDRTSDASKTCTPVPCGEPFF